jgi:protein-tyrosine phosphatase
LNRYIDMHAHILPCADHGSDSLETSLWQLSAAEKAGVSVIAATPHYYPDRLSGETFFERRDTAVNMLKEAYKGPITVLPGAELYLCEGIQNHPRLHDFCIFGTSVLLVEMPNPPWTSRYDITLSELQNRGYTVLLAHIERYPAKDMDRLFDMGYMGQCNAESFKNILTRRRLLKLIDDGCIMAVGSDIHGVDRKAYEVFASEMSLLGNKAELLQLRSVRLIDSGMGERYTNDPG